MTIDVPSSTVSISMSMNPRLAVGRTVTSEADITQREANKWPQSQLSITVDRS